MNSNSTKKKAVIGDIVSINYGDEYILKVVDAFEWSENRVHEDYRHNRISIDDVEDCDYVILYKKEG